MRRAQSDRCVSVPSSSGRSVRLVQLLGRGTQTSAFQSPPHRGDRCDWAATLGVIMVDGIRFSPLLIGEIGATWMPRAGIPADLAVSVPSSSGRSVRPCDRSCPAFGLASVSVPSSSGRSVRLDERAHPARSRLVFQSPPHRGDRCDSTTSGGTGITVDTFQSPPHRGDRCDLAEVVRRPRLPRVSVPSSSGRSVRHRRAMAPTKARLYSVSVPSSSGRSVRRCRLELGDPRVQWVSVPSSSGRSVRLRSRAQHHDLLFPARFSPLLIGEIGATRCDIVVRIAHSLTVSVPSSSGRSVRLDRARLADPASLAFQSPPHRGDRCDHAAPRDADVGESVSVPSSSGRSVRPGPPVSERATCDRCFSPLLIGEIGATSRCSRLHPSVTEFQSPPHRGDRCDLGCAQRRVANAACFSPLLIGEIGATFDLLGTVRLDVSRFSPLLIGEIGATFNARSRVTGHLTVSVPSSSGRSVRHTCDVPRIRRSALVSVPSSSGRSVRPPNLPCKIVDLCRTEGSIFSQQPELLQIASHLRNSLPYVVAVVAKLATDATRARRRRFRHPFAAHEASNLVDGRNHLLP